VSRLFPSDLLAGVTDASQLLADSGFSVFEKLDAGDLKMQEMPARRAASLAPSQFPTSNFELRSTPLN